MESSEEEIAYSRRTFGARVPWVSGAIIAASVAMFLLASPLLPIAPAVRRQATEIGVLYGPAVVAGEWWRTLAHVIEHGNILHLFLNMSVVFTLGFSLERAISSWRFLLISLITALGAATFVLLFAFDQKTVGASGMILGWAGALLPIANQQGRRSLGMWLVQIAIISVLPGVSWQGHLGGFLFGLPCGVLLRRRAQMFGWLAPVLLIGAAAATWLAVQQHLPSGRRVYSVRKASSALPSVDAIRNNTF